MDIKFEADSFLDELNKDISILEFRDKSLNEGHSKKLSSLDFIVHEVEIMQSASIVLQQLIDKVSKQNILKIEELVNRALSNIFYDKNLTIEIVQNIKRNVNSYDIEILKGGIRGGKKSYGGGVICIIGFILKFIFNILNKNFPLAGFDETLSFLSVEYIEYASSFIKELSKEFNLPTLMITHQSKFCEAADIRYLIKGISENHSEILKLV
jgi:DNA repair exonuclease SbcCD ATPase subunit